MGTRLHPSFRFILRTHFSTIRSFDSKKLRDFKTIDSLSEALPLFSKLSPEQACEIMSRFLELKFSGQRKVRISSAAIRVISSAVVDKVAYLSPSSITTLIRGVGDSTSSMDEYLMYILAQEVTVRAVFFRISDLFTILSTFCKRDLMDIDMIESCVTQILNSSEVRKNSDILNLFRNLSSLNYNHLGLTEYIESNIISSPHLSPKDIVNLIIGLSQLGLQPRRELWNMLEKRSNSPLSHDDEYRLIFAAITFDPSPWVRDILIPRIFKNSENRIRKRKALYELSLNLARSAPLYISKTSLHEPSVMTASSGLHLEVASCLESLQIPFQMEQDCKGFLVDIIL